MLFCLSCTDKTNDRELLQSTCGPDQSSLLHLAVESCSAHTVVYLLHKGVNTRSIVSVQSCMRTLTIMSECIDL